MRILGRHGESKAEECEGTKRTLELVGIEGFDSSKPGNQMNQLNLKLKERKIRRRNCFFFRENLNARRDNESPRVVVCPTTEEITCRLAV